MSVITTTHYHLALTSRGYAYRSIGEYLRLWLTQDMDKGVELSGALRRNEVLHLRNWIVI
jgi:hypothetical protein